MWLYQPASSSACDICDIAGTGKSFTIEGGDEEENRGLIPRSSEEIFSCILQYNVTLIL